MNERIDELVKKFAEDFLARSGCDVREFDPFLVESRLFAESIVRECAEIADNADATREKWQSIGKFVREHFGVK